MGMLKVAAVGAAVYFAADYVMSNVSIQTSLGANAKYAPYAAAGAMLVAAKHFGLLS